MTTEGFKLKFETEDRSAEETWAPQVPGVLEQDGNGQIMSLEEYKEFLDASYSCHINQYH